MHLYNLVVFAFSVSYIDRSGKKILHLLFLAMDTWTDDTMLYLYLYYQAGEVWGKGNACPAFQFISLIHLFIHCIFVVLVTHILIYRPESYLERRELNNEKRAVKPISSDFESLPVSMYVCDFTSVE